MKMQFNIPSALFLCICTSLFAQTTIPGGDVSGIWDTDGSPYQIEGDITIPDDSTLSIQPGVEIEFQGHFSLKVLGRLLAIGTESDSIHFTISDTTGFSNPGSAAGGWYGIRFADTPLENDSSKLVYCCLEYGKAFGDVWHLNAGGAICILQFGKVLISDCLIKDNSAYSSSEHPSIGGGIYFFRSDVILRNNTFLNNHAQSGGAIYFDESNPVFENNLIKENNAEYGGGIGMGGVNQPSFSGDYIMNNMAAFNGGGLLLAEPSVVLCDQVSIEGNKAVWGAGIGNQGGELQASDCKFSGNHAEIWGGGVACDNGILNLIGCTFDSDSSDWGSGGLHADHSDVHISQCVFTENVAVIGGGFHSLSSQIVCTQSSFLDNQSESGGGMHLEDSDCEIDQCLFQMNSALVADGGAIAYNASASVFGRNLLCTMRRTSFLENTAFDQAAAVDISQVTSDSSLVDVLVDSCLFKSNHSSRLGSMRINGPIEDFTVSNSIFNGNTAELNTGGPAFRGSAIGTVFNCTMSFNYSEFSDSTKTLSNASVGAETRVDLINCTFVDSSSANGYAISFRRGAEASITNCILWGCGDHPISLYTAADLGCTVDVNYCNIENGMDSIYVSDTSSVLNWGIGNMAEDPRFVDLAGGDFHLMDSSPCIGAGINSLLLNEQVITAPSSDLEGRPRPDPQGTQADIGAFENALGSPINTGIDQDRISDGPVLDQNYPNPFRTTTTFTYRISVPGMVHLYIYNIFGQQVATVVSENQAAGRYRVEWDGSMFSSGTYLYRLETGKGLSQTGKLLLLK